MSSTHASIEDIQKTHLGTYRSNPDRIESDAGTERQDRADYDGRFIFELLQNAVDEMGNTPDPDVRFELSENALLVANNGAAFTIDDLYALTLTTRTTKAGDTSIGHKGRGFTSVLGITDRPAVFSPSVAARFDREQTAEILSAEPDIREAFPDGLAASDVPVLGLPNEATPSSAVQNLLDEGYTTVFEFPLRDPENLCERIERKLRALGENTVALLPELNRIQIDCSGWERTWRVDRETISDYPDASLVHLTRETTTPGRTEQDTQSFVVFETDEIDRTAIIEQSNLSKVEVDTMGKLSVGVGFIAEPTCKNPSTNPADWRLAPVYGETDDQPPHMHVFLPTKERSPIPALITGTFQSDTSRRNLTLDHNDERGYDGQFNAALFAELGGLLAETVVPFIDVSATTPAEFLATLDPSLGGAREWSFTPGSVEHCLFETFTERISTVPFVPPHRGEVPRTITELGLPHTAAETDGLGTAFAELLNHEHVTDGAESKYLPAADLLTYHTTNTLEALGATRLPPEAIPRSLDEASANPPLREYSTDQPTEQAESNESGDAEGDTENAARLWIDPILVHLVEVRKTLESDDERDAFDAACRSTQLFPTGTSTDANETRVAVRTRTCDQSLFLPPEEDVARDSLPTLAFLARELYHGTDPNAAPELRKAALPTGFRSELESIWRIESFSFERVFDAAIRPWIPGPNSRDVDTAPLETTETLATIRKLAAVRSPENDRDPTKPLLYRSSRRSFFDLSKLPIPAVPLNGGKIEWQPAHRVYVPQDWQEPLDRPNNAQIEPLLTDVNEQSDTDRFDPWFLPPLKWFDLEASDTAEIEEWVAFFRWLGVAEHVRPLPLFAPDASTRHRYRKTKGFQQPPRSAIAPADDLAASDETTTPVDPRYSGLSDDEWATYREHLLDNVDPELDVKDHGYLYQINPLEYAEEILSAAAADESVGTRLLNHLATWWDTELRRHQHGLAAEFTNNRWRGSNRSYFFRSKERRAAGVNLWVWQLQQHDWVPTSQGTVAPPRAWLLPSSDRERFSLQLDGNRSLLPFVKGFHPTDTGTDTTDAFTSALGIGTQLEQEQFSPDDVECVLLRVHDHLQNASVEPGRFAGEVELIYTRVAELLPGLQAERIADPEWRPEQTGLDTASILCRDGDSYEFYPASESYFVRSHTDRQRYRNLGLPHIVLFKPEAARFGTLLSATDTAAVVTKMPCPGDDIGIPANVNGTTIDEGWIETVLVALLLRLRSDRPSAAAVDQDTSNTRRFYQQLEIVDGLELELTTTEPAAQFETDTRPQPYHITRGDGRTKSAVLIDGSLPDREFVDAVARAYTDYLDIPQYYEGVYNLIEHAFGESSPEATLLDRLRILGNGMHDGQFDVARSQLFEDEGGTEIVYEESEKTDRDTSNQSDTSISVERDLNTTEQADSGSASRSNRVPDVEKLTRIGESRIYEPESPRTTSVNTTDQTKTVQRQRNSSGSGATPASQEYRTKIDDFGMALTIESEGDRLRQNDEPNPETKVWDVSTPETYGEAKGDSEIKEPVNAKGDPDLVKQAIDNFLTEAGLSEDENPFATDWPGFDVLTIATGEDDEPRIDRCIELKTSGLKTRKPSLSWNEWKAAGSTLADRYYLYVARNIRVGKSGDATLLEIPRPFETLTKHRRERREREVQLDLRSFDLDDDLIIERPVEWDE
ncbi:sacsin N-terminal ATP-binding-like domain-containing protein [Natrialbaceae archaeon A-CW2]